MQRGFASLLIIAIFAILVAIIIGSSFYLKNNSANFSGKNNSITPQSTNSSNTSDVEPLKKDISFALVNNEPLLKYKDLVFSKNSDQQSNPPKNTSNYPNVDWVGLVDIEDIKEKDLNELYKDNIIWSITTNGDSIYFLVPYSTIYEYNYKNKKLNPYEIIISDIDGNNWTAPRLVNFHPSGRYVLVNLVPCTECGPGYPKSAIFDFKDQSIKGVGAVTDFEWVGNDKYRYKRYETEECDDPNSMTGMCQVDPAKQPFIFPMTLE